MKNKTSLFLLTLLVLLSLVSNAQNSSSTVFLQLYEAAAGYAGQSYIVTLTPNDEQEITLLQKFKPKPESVASNFLEFKKEITKWLDQGYILVNISQDNLTRPRVTAILTKYEIEN